jgi:valyl-tRNA synthetase
MIRYFANIKKIAALGPDIKKPKNAATVIVGSGELFIHDVINHEAERARFEKQKEKIEKAKEAVEAKLSNENFVNKAKPQVVAQARNRLAELSEQLKTVEKHLSDLENSE